METDILYTITDHLPSLFTLRLSCRQCYQDIAPMPNDPFGCTYAVSINNRSLLDWALKNNFPWSTPTTAAAAAHNNFGLLQWLVAKCCPIDQSTLLAAVRNNHLPTVSWYLQRFKSYDSHSILETAVQHGHDELVYFLLQDNNDYDFAALCACRHGRLRILRNLYRSEQWQHQDTSYSKEAAAGNHLDVLVWLNRRNFFMGDVCSYAARHGNLPMLELAQRLGAEWETTMREAAEHGHVHIIDWARRHSCPTDPDLLAIAVRKGQLSVLEWCCDHDYVLSKDLCEDAARYGQYEILSWLHHRGCPWNEFVCSEAALYGHIRILSYAYKNSCPWNSAVCSNAVLCGRLDILIWARARGCPWRKESCRQQAVAMRRQDIVAWIDQH